MIKIDEYFGSPFEKWAKAFCYRNHWRVQHLLGGDVEDMEAQCALYWVQCYMAYQKTVHDDALMMYMFKLWVSGQISDISVKESKHKERFVDPIPTQYDYWTEGTVQREDVGQYREGRVIPNMEPVIHSEAELHLKLESASLELKEVLKIFMDAPKEIMDLLRDECKSSCPKSFFKKVVSFLKMDETKSTQLAKELQQLLS